MASPVMAAGVSQRTWPQRDDWQQVRKEVDMTPYSLALFLHVGLLWRSPRLW